MQDFRHEDIQTYEAPAYKKRRRRFGDRKEGRRVRTLAPMAYVEPYIMKTRSDAQNHFEDVIDIHNIELYLDKKHKEGYTDMTLLHVILAAYVRTVSERPGINRFVAGQKIYARKTIDCNMVIKKEMTLEAPDTCIKVEFDPRDTALNVYKKFQKTAVAALEAPSDFDKISKFLTKYLPGLLFRGAVACLRFLDYFGLLPKFLLNVSPFHSSMFITSMGSLGIPAIYHHLYDFGTLPIFISYGSIYSAEVVKRSGEKERHHFVTLKVVTDERICDGYYYASAMKRMKRILLHPEILDENPTTVVEDID